MMYTVTMDVSPLTGDEQHWFYTGEAGFDWFSPDVNKAFEMGLGEAQTKLQIFKKTRPDLKLDIGALV